eukprot:10685452-Alexandrium_andersonii.AAC.1
MGEDASTQQRGMSRKGATRCLVRVLPRIEPRPPGRSPERVLKGLCEGGLASLVGISATGTPLVLCRTQMCDDLADVLARMLGILIHFSLAVY